MAEETNNTEQKEEQKEAKRSYNKRYTADELNEAVQKAVAEALAKQSAQPQTVVQVAQDEYVTILYIGAIAQGTVVALPKWGQITYAGGMLDIPKKDFLQGIGIQVNNALLKNRKILVISGLTDAERKRFGLEYKEGEYLTAEALTSILGYDKDQVCEIFTKLCDEHKRTVAKIYLSAYFDNGDNRINRETVKVLNKISKTIEKDGLFTPILEDMGRKDAE